MNSRLQRRDRPPPPRAPAEPHPGAVQEWRLLALVMLALAACDDGGGGGGSPTPEYWVVIESPATPVTSEHVDLTGLAWCDACPPDDVAFGGCPPVHGPFPSALDVQWSNLTTGASGAAQHLIAGQCACLFSTCWVSYFHRFLAQVPLAMGPNEIEVACFGPEYLPGSETITVTRVPPAPLGLEARAGAGEIELSWQPVAAADAYVLYWSETRTVERASAHAIPGASSPFRHLGLADDTTLHYAVAAVAAGHEGPLSALAWATAGWPSESLPVRDAPSSQADTAIATDGLDHAHVHVSRRAPDGTGELNEYASDAGGMWEAHDVARTVWRDADLALDSTGTVHLAYLYAGGLVHAWGPAGAWSTELVDAAGTCDASLALDARDVPHLVYRAASPPELRYAERASGAWLAERVDAADLGCVVGGARLALAVESDGTPHVVHAGTARGLLHGVRRAGVWSHETIEEGSVTGSALALAADGTPHVAFVDAQLVLWHALREASGSWSRTRIDPEPNVATPALALDAHGHAHVAYLQESYGGELRWATDELGAWRVVPVAPAVYADVALALDPGGALHVSYFDAHGARVAVRRGAVATLRQQWASSAGWAGGAHDQETRTGQVPTLFEQAGM